MSYLATSKNTYIKTKETKTPYGNLSNLNSGIVYLDQKVNEDGSCNLELSTEIKRGQPYVCSQLEDGTLVFATATGDLGYLDPLRAVSGVYLNGKNIRIIPTGKSISKISDIYNKTVAELTADDLRGLTTIPANFQNSNSQLGKVEIPNTVVTIGDGAFQYSSISEIIFEEPSMCTSIGKNAFGSWANSSVAARFTKIKFPDSVEIVGLGSFVAAWSLKTIEFGTGIQSIGAFGAYTDSIRNVILHKRCVTEEDVPILSGALPSKATVYVEDETTQTLLQNATNWSASTIKLISELPEEV